MYKNIYRATMDLTGGRTAPPGTCQVGRLVRRTGGPPRRK